jgi:hypothetical protein
VTGLAFHVLLPRFKFSFVNLATYKIWPDAHLSFRGIQVCVSNICKAKGLVESLSESIVEVDGALHGERISPRVKLGWQLGRESKRVVPLASGRELHNVELLRIAGNNIEARQGNPTSLKGDTDVRRDYMSLVGYLDGDGVQILSNFWPSIRNYNGSHSSNYLLPRKHSLLHDMTVSVIHRPKLISSESSVNSGGEERSGSRNSRHPLYANLALVIGVPLAFGVFCFVSFRFDPNRWQWQFPLCLLLLVLSFLLIAYGVYALAESNDFISQSFVENVHNHAVKGLSCVVVSGIWQAVDSVVCASSRHQSESKSRIPVVPERVSIFNDSINNRAMFASGWMIFALGLEPRLRTAELLGSIWFHGLRFYVDYIIEIERWLWREFFVELEENELSTNFGYPRWGLSNITAAYSYENGSGSASDTHIVPTREKEFSENPRTFGIDYSLSAFFSGISTAANKHGLPDENCESDQTSNNTNNSGPQVSSIKCRISRSIGVLCVCLCFAFLFFLAPRCITARGFLGYCVLGIVSFFLSLFFLDCDWLRVGVMQVIRDVKP